MLIGWREGLVEPGRPCYYLKNYGEQPIRGQNHAAAARIKGAVLRKEKNPRLGLGGSKNEGEIMLEEPDFVQAIAPADEPGYTQLGDGGAGMSTDERITGVEICLDNIEKKVDTLEKKVNALPRWVVGTGLVCVGIGLAVVFGLIQLQSGWFQKNIDAHQRTFEVRLEEFRKVSEAQLEEFRKVSEARAEEFRRDSARNYDLALKAFERSMVQPEVQPQPAQEEPAPPAQPEPTPTPQDPPSE